VEYKFVGSLESRVHLGLHTSRYTLTINNGHLKQGLWPLGLCSVSPLCNPSMATAQCVREYQHMKICCRHFTPQKMSVNPSLFMQNYLCTCWFFLPDMSSAPGAAGAAAAAVASPPVDSGRSNQNVPYHTTPGQRRLMSHSHRSIRAKKG